MKVTALIPVKGFRNAKQRLSAILNSAQREALAESMFRDVLHQVLGARGLFETVVVTGDDKVAQIAGSLGAKFCGKTLKRVKPTPSISHAPA